MNVISLFKKTAWKDCRIVLPEAGDERIIKAAAIAKRKKIAKPVFIDISKGVAKRYIDAYVKLRKVPPGLAERILSNPLFLGALMVRMGEADAMVAGAVSTSGDVITAAEGIIGLRKGVSVPSSFFIMEMPYFKNKEGGLLLFADSSVNIELTAEQMADVAITTAHTAKELMNWTPRVAMLSFSTKGSAVHERVDKVAQATKIANKKAPRIAIDGELQGDSALVEATAKKKMKGKAGKVAGRANVLIFPDLDSGNISYKLVQTLAKANAYGPILQGFDKPVSDLSRGAKVEDIVGTMAILSTWAKRVSSARFRVSGDRSRVSGLRSPVSGGKEKRMSTSGFQ